MITPGPRTRSQSVSVPVTGNNYYTVGGNVQTYPFSYYKKSYGRTTNDIVTENFRERVKNGEIIMNPYDSVAFNEEITPARGSIFDGSGTWTVNCWGDHNLCPLQEAPSFDYSTELQIQLTKAYAKVTSETASMWVTLGEIRETKDMFIGAVRKLHTVQKHLRNWAYLTHQGASARDVMNAWLEVRYGWKPFYHDVMNYVEAANKVEELVKRQTFRSGTVKRLDPAQSVWSRTDGPNILTFARYSTTEIRLGAGVIAHQRYAGFPDTYGMWKIPQTVWELTRLSFVVDWFFDVGSTIAAWTPDTLWDPVGCWQKVYIVKRYNVSQTSHTFSQSGYTGGTSGFSRSRVEETRIRIPNPSRSFIPNFRFQMNWKRYTDAVALGSQFWSGTKTIIARALDAKKRF